MVSVLFLTGGFPSPEQPSKSVFNFRAARGLNTLADVHVVHLRYWRPGRALVSAGTYSGLKVTTIGLPYVPPASLTTPLLIRGWCALARRQLETLCRHTNVIHSVGADLGGMLGADLAHRFEKPHLCQVIGSDLFFHLPKLERSARLDDWVGGVDLALCNSDALRAEWNRQYPGGPDAVTVYRGTDLDKHEGARPPTDHARRFLFLGGYSNRTSTGHGVDLKGAATLMAAWTQLDDDPSFDGKLVFGGPNGAASQVRAWHASLTRSDRVRLCGLLPPERVRDAIVEADVVLVPSRSEGLPNIAVEAAATKRVVFGSRVGGIPEIVIDHETGLLLAPGNVAAWRDAIRDAAAGVYPLESWGVAARRRTKRHFDQRRYPSAIRALYDRISQPVPAA